MQTIQSVYLVSRRALELLFTVQSTGDGLPGKFTFGPSISPQRTVLILLLSFFSLLPAEIGFWSYTRRPERWRAVSADIVLLARAARNTEEGKIIKRTKREEDITGEIARWVLLSCPSSVRSAVEMSSWDVAEDYTRCWWLLALTCGTVHSPHPQDAGGREKKTLHVAKSRHPCLWVLIQYLELRLLPGCVLDSLTLQIYIVAGSTVELEESFLL